jgi:hypothetical protein
MSGKSPTNTLVPAIQLVRDKVSFSLDSGVTEADYVGCLDRKWLNSIAFFPNASLTRPNVAVKFGFKFIKLAAGTCHSTSYQSFANSLF